MDSTEHPVELPPLPNMAEGFDVGTSSINDTRIIDERPLELEQALNTNLREDRLETPGEVTHNEETLLSDQPLLRDSSTALGAKHNASSDSQGRQVESNLSLQTVVQVLLATCSAMFLGQAILAANVNSTFFQTYTKYLPGGGVPIYLKGGYIYPNASWSYTYTPKPALISFLNVKLLEAAKLGPTIYPILFAAVISTTIRLIARWWVEQGLLLNTLEVLIGSRSLFSTASTIYSVRAKGALGIGLVLLWAMSPLAGQASLRVLSKRTVSDVSISFPWAVPNHTRLNASTVDSTQMRKSGYVSTLSYAMTNRDNEFDQNGFPLLAMNKISHFSPLVNASHNYANLVGLEIIGPLWYITFLDPQKWDVMNSVGLAGPPEGSIKLSSENIASYSTQYEMRCPSSAKYSSSDTWTAMLGPDSIYSNSSVLLDMATSGSGFFVDIGTGIDLQATESHHLIFGSFSKSHITLWQCSIYESTRSFRADCEVDGQCSFTDVGTPTTTDSVFFKDPTIAADILRRWPLADPGSINRSSLTEQFLANGLATSPPLLVFELSDLDNVTFSTRFTTVFNTWISSLKPAKLNMSDEQSWVKIDNVMPLKIAPFSIVLCNWYWFTILTSTSVFLILCCFLSIWVQYQLTTPDILGYVSASTIDNPYILLDEAEPGSSSTLDGLRRARLLGKMKVQIRDVHPQDEVGNFALTNGVVDSARAGKERRYV